MNPMTNRAKLREFSRGYEHGAWSIGEGELEPDTDRYARRNHWWVTGYEYAFMEWAEKEALVDRIVETVWALREAGLLPGNEPVVTPHSGFYLREP